jgi:uncharacterized Tic20 family protein
MITSESNRKSSSRNTVKISDLAIIFGATTTSFWKTLFYKTWDEFALLCLKQYFRFNRALSAFQMWCVFRVKPGYQTMGVLVILASLGFQIGYNSTNVANIFKPFGMFFGPPLIFFKTRDQLYELIFIDIESKVLLVYTIVFTLCSLTHLIMIWAGKGNKSITKRGESLIVKGLSKYMRVDEFIICGLLEPLLFIALGFASWKLADDIHFFGFTLFTGLSELSQQVLDRAFQADRDSIVKA